MNDATEKAVGAIVDTMQTFVFHFQHEVEEMVADKQLKIDDSTRAGLDFVACICEAIYTATDNTIKQLVDEAEQDDSDRGLA